jgi:CTP synthase (UTP-ammonia lyase)
MLKEYFMVEELRIGVVGDFEPSYHSHFATNAAFYDAAAALGAPLHLRWLPTPEIDGSSGEHALEPFDGLVASPGSPYRSFSGMLRGIEFARTRNWPFVGT